MRHRPPWDFLLLVTLAATIPASSPAGAASDGSLSAVSVPDFSGTWVHPHFPGIAPPVSGPGVIKRKAGRSREGGVAPDVDIKCNTVRLETCGQRPSRQPHAGVRSCILWQREST
jgi:hypothetical protein